VRLREVVPPPGVLREVVAVAAGHTAATAVKYRLSDNVI
jgi:hypothetical protein